MAITPDILFVNPAYLKRTTQLTGNIDDNRLIPAIILAQDKHLQVYLGTALYEALKSHVANQTLAGEYEALMDTHVRKVVAWWTIVELLPDLRVQMTEAGPAIRSIDNAASISASDLGGMMDRARRNAQFYTTRMSDYLCEGGHGISEYYEASGAQMLARRARYTQSGYSITGGPDFDLLKQYIG